MPASWSRRRQRLSFGGAAVLTFFVFAACCVSFVPLPDSADRPAARPHRGQTELAAAAEQSSSRRDQLLLAAAAGITASSQPVGRALAFPWDKEEPLTVFDVDVKVNLGGDAGEEASFTIRIDPEWAPRGALQMFELIDQNFFANATIFRVVPGFVAQFGLPATPRPRLPPLRDDPVKVSNKRGTLTFATSGPNSRTTQLFFNYKDNTFLDNQGFSPIGEVLGNGMSVVDRFYAGYREQPQQGPGTAKGNEYFDKNFPKLARIVSMKIKQ